MKYDNVDVEGGGNVTSHTLVRMLVGENKRVLDVGCSTGYLAAALREAGNSVTGVEMDPAAAEKARPHLDELLVADLDSTDLSTRFQPSSFDAIVFADVLEHLKDPTATLRQVRELLTESGSVIISIPNVAHAAVRLSLLAGRFDYTSVGLLDETHLRFFTRQTVEKLLADAGFTGTEYHRTTAEPFETEIDLQPTDFPSEVLDTIDADSESRTYQFVIRAVPTDRLKGRTLPSASDSADVWAARRQLATITASLSRIKPLPFVAVVGGQGVGIPGAIDAIRSAVVLAELRRRLVGVEARAFALAVSPEPSDITGEAVWPVNPHRPSADYSLSDASSVLVTFEQPPEVVADLVSMSPGAISMSHPQSAFAPGDETDPVFLARRVLDADLLRLRVDYLRRTGAFCTEERVALIQGVSDGFSASTMTSVLQRNFDMAVVEPPPDIGPLDLAAMVSASSLVLTSDRALTLLACAFERPVVVIRDGHGGFADWAAESGLPVGHVDDVAALAGAAEAQPLDLWSGLSSAIDAMFDDLSVLLTQAAGEQVASTADARIREMASRIAVLEAVNGGLRKRMDLERRALLGALRSASAGTANIDQENALSGPELGAVAQVARLKRESSELRDEIDRIYQTRLMRVARPARNVYARLRRLSELRSR